MQVQIIYQPGLKWCWEASKGTDVGPLSNYIATEWSDGIFHVSEVTNTSRVSKVPRKRRRANQIFVECVHVPFL